MFDWTLAFGAEHPEQALANKRAHGVGNQKRLDSHVHQPGYPADGVICVQGAEDQMPVGAGGIAISAVSRSRISPTMMTFHHLKELSETVGESEINLRFDSDLDDSRQLVLNRVFNGHNPTLFGVETR